MDRLIRTCLVARKVREEDALLTERKLERLPGLLFQPRP